MKLSPKGNRDRAGSLDVDGRLSEVDGAIHDWCIVANSGWRINLSRVLDIFQFVSNDTFDLAVKLQQYRQVKAFGVTFIRESREIV